MKARYNYLEEQTRQLLKSYLYNVQAFEKGNSIFMMKSLIEMNDKNKIFFDAESPYFTYNNNPKRTEFVVHAPMYNIYWRIECKSQVQNSNMVSRLYDELYYVTELPEDKIFFVLEGALLYPKVLMELTNRIEKHNLSDRVLFGDINIFREELIRKMSA